MAPFVPRKLAAMAADRLACPGLRISLPTPHLPPVIVPGRPSLTQRVLLALHGRGH